MPDLDLNEPQREAVDYSDGHLLVLAGAGSGKTRVLTCRIARLVETGRSQPWRILAMTFTNKAAGEMSARVEAMLGGKAGRIRMGTFHSVCAWILRREAGAGGWPENFSIYDSDDQKALLRQIIRNAGMDGRVTPAQASSFISGCKNALTGPDEAVDSARTPWDKLLADIYVQYQARLRVNGAFDFDDLLTEALSYIRHDADTRARYGSLFDNILVDEYQDTNLAQREILLALAGPGTTVSAVGDDDQSIYGWRGARVENILGFQTDFPGARIIRLEQNYRSTSCILRAASALVAHNAGRHGKTLWTARAGGDDVLVQSAQSPGREARWILEEAERLFTHNGIPWREMAVLYRTNAQSRELETAAAAMHVPYQIVGSVRFFEREEIKDLTAWLKVVVNPGDAVSLSRVINKPPRGLGDRGREAFFEHASSSGTDLITSLGSADRIQGLSRKSAGALRELGGILSSASRAALSGAPASEVVDRLLAEMGFLDQYAGKGAEEEARAENIAEFRRTAHEYDASNPSGGLPGFLQGISLMTGADDYDGDTDRMVFMTLHCAKGLEFRVVFVAGVEEGLLPFVRPGEYSPADLEEERRLMYVGMTRARDILYLTHVHDRDRPGVRTGGPSRFISEAASAFAAAETPVRAPAAAGGTTVFSRGNLVHHPRYGRGIVLHAARRGSEWQLTVDFGFDEPKVLLTGYVPITLLKEKGTREEAF